MTACFSPTARQQDILRFVHGFRIARDRAPTLSEIAAGVGMAGKGTVHRVIRSLEERGHVRRSGQGEIEIVIAPAIPRSPDGAPLYFVPLAEVRP